MNIEDQGHSGSTFQTSFPEKPLGRLMQNFTWSLSGMGKWNYIQMVQVTWPRWPPCSYLVKTWKILLLRNHKGNGLESLHAALGTRVLPSLLTLTYLIARSNLVHYAFVWDFSETIVVYDIKVGRCSHLNDYMKLWVPKVKVIDWAWSKSLRFNILQLLFLNNHWPDWSKIACGAFLEWVNEGCLNDPGHMTKMAAMFIYNKYHQKYFSLKSKGTWPWNLVYSIEYPSTIKFVQMLPLGWP